MSQVLLLRRSYIASASYINASAHEITRVHCIRCLVRRHVVHIFTDTHTLHTSTTTNTTTTTSSMHIFTNTINVCGVVVCTTAWSLVRDGRLTFVPRALSCNLLFQLLNASGRVMALPTYLATSLLTEVRSV